MPASANGQAAAKKAPVPEKAAPKAEAPAESGGARFNPGIRPDPFLNPLLLRKNQVDMDEEVPRGTPPPGIGGMTVAEVQLLGIANGPEGRTAVFRGTDKHVYFLRQGDHLFDGSIQSINNDHVLLVQVTVLRSGKVLSKEITKSFRTK